MHAVFAPSAIPAVAAMHIEHHKVALGEFKVAVAMMSNVYVTGVNFTKVELHVDLASRQAMGGRWCVSPMGAILHVLSCSLEIAETSSMNSMASRMIDQLLIERWWYLTCNWR